MFQTRALVLPTGFASVDSSTLALRSFFQNLIEVTRVDIFIEISKQPTAYLQFSQIRLPIQDSNYH